MKNKLAILGGKPIRKKNMPSRHAMGTSEIKMINFAIKYYKNKGEDPPYQGKFEEEFCKLFAKIMGGGYVDAVSSGCAALYVSLASLNLKKGSEILLSPVTCSSDLAVIVLQGFKPILLDSAKWSYNVNLEEIKKKLQKKLKLHYFLMLLANQ